ncbi:MAG: hypothetical protein ACI35S_05400 [Anaeroplasma sp.]
MTQSKRDLINKLIKMYPYSEEWFSHQSEKKLWAMYYSYKPKEEITSQRKISTFVESRVTYILTDAGVYEEMYD